VKQSTLERMSDSTNDEITITLTSMTTMDTESISVSSGSTTIADLSLLAAALLNLPNSDDLILSKDGQRLPATTVSSTTLSAANIHHGDLILVAQSAQGRAQSQSNSQSNATHTPRTTNAIANTGANASVGLDFSALLGPSSSRQPQPSSSSAGRAAQTGGLTFHLPAISASASSTGNNSNGISSSTQTSQSKPVQWSGMSLNEAISNNPNPKHFTQLLLDTQNHPNMLKELNYHNAALAKKIKQANPTEAPSIWRNEIQKSTINSTLSKNLQDQTKASMERRLHLNPMDQEANAYFGDQIRKKNVADQYSQMMEDFPESMGRVLMLYIDVEVNGHALQAFVDSGAQSTIMSSECADRCGLLHLLDDRFAGVAVGVGTGKILGRVHMAPIKVGGQFFPCSVTVMDSEKGLGDKNMEFLFGLDMLKRHRCSIDLRKNSLVFSGDDGVSDRMEAPFLHEKDLRQDKGGTKDFDVELSNKEVEMRMEEENEENKSSGQKKEGLDDETK